MRFLPTCALPPIWLLGSSGYSAELAAAVGMGFAFAHHFANYDAASAMLAYREHFKPSASLAKPCAMLGTAVIAADSDAEAERLASSADLHYRAARQRRISAACFARGGRRLSLCADRS